ncbi:TNF receptor-associated factor 5 [Paramecium bursaria]
MSLKQIQINHDPIDTRQIQNWDQVKVHVQPNLCMECSLVPQNPYQCYKCSKLICYPCHTEQKAKARGPKIFCQKCKALQYFNPANNSVFQAYRELVIACVNKRYGCRIQTDYKKYQKHIDECDYQRLPCNSPGCFVTTLKRYKQEHLTVCEYVVETCDNCNKQFNRKSMAYHQEKCGAEEQTGDVQQLKVELLKLRNKLDSVLQMNFQQEIKELQQKLIQQQQEIVLIIHQHNIFKFTQKIYFKYIFIQNCMVFI